MSSGRWQRSAVVAVVAGAVAACSGGGSGAGMAPAARSTASGVSSATATPLPAQDVAAAVADHLRTERTARTHLVAEVPASLPGGPFNADLTGGVDVVADDADLQGEYDGAVRDYRIVHGVQYLSLQPGEGTPGQRWTRDPQRTSLPGAALSDATRLPLVLSAFTDPRLVGAEPSEGRPAYHYTAGVDAQRFATALGTSEDRPFLLALGLLGLHADVWVLPDGTPVRILVRAGQALSAPASAAPSPPPQGAVTFAAEFTGFGTPVSVTAPPGY